MWTMEKKIKIEKATIELPTKIEISGKKYPIHPWNINVVRDYWKTGDVKELDKLKDFSLEL